MCDELAVEARERHAVRRAQREARLAPRRRAQADEWLAYAGIVAPAAGQNWMLRACAATHAPDYIANSGFRYPTDGVVLPDSFDDSFVECSNGLHGLRWAAQEVDYLPKHGLPQILFFDPVDGCRVTQGKTRVGRAWVLPVPKPILMLVLAGLRTLSARTIALHHGTTFWPADRIARRLGAPPFNLPPTA